MRARRRNLSAHASRTFLTKMVCLALAGGVGGARMAHGLSMVLHPEDLIIAVNVGDDFTHLGLRICPDLDTVMYTLAGLANPETGWGIEDETWNVMNSIKKLGGPDWFALGDRDLATHLERTRQLAAGTKHSDVTKSLCNRLDIAHKIVPISEQAIPTIVETPEGDLSFQEYFVKQKCKPQVTGVRFAGATEAGLSHPLRHAIDAGEIDCVICCPSNPFLSIDPILALPEIRELLTTALPVVAVSPIVGGRAIKGPAAKLMREFGLPPSTLGIAAHYSGIINGIVIDTADEADVLALRESGLKVLLTDTVMTTDEVRETLARQVLTFVQSLHG